MKYFFYLIVLSFYISTAVFAQSAIEKGEDQVKMFNAQQKFYKGDFKGALNIYNDVLKSKPNDANVMFHIAECQYEMKEYDNAKQMAEKANAIDPKANEGLPLLSGKLNLREGKLDEALTDFNLYKSIVGEGRKLQESDCNIYISQVNNAKTLIAAPIGVKIENMGNMINSEQDDKGPTISADGKLLVFNSRRPGKSNMHDMQGDGGYFEDIYISRWDSVRNMWAEPELIPGALNTEGHDACTSLSPDGKQIFLYKNDIEEESRGGDIYVSKIGSTGRWGAPKAMGTPVNTTYWEGGACLSPDGKTLYIISERKGGLGHGDIYICKKDGSNWETPVNMGPEINSAMDEGGIFLAPDGKTLFFASNGHGSMGGYDIFKTVLENGKWSKPVNMGYPINTVNNDMSLTLSVDAKVGYFASDRKGGFGERDLYMVDLSNYRVLEKEMSAPVKEAENKGPVMGILKGDIFDATEGKGIEVEIMIFDEAGNKIGSTSSSNETGEYFTTLEANKTYVVKIDKKGYKSIEEKFVLNAAKQGATTLVKHFLLYKQD